MGFVEVDEQDRVYTFPAGDKVEIIGVRSIHVSKSGTHRINTLDGKKHIIPNTWIHIEFSADKWTF